MPRISPGLRIILAFFVIGWATPSFVRADWPTWRGAANRGASTAAEMTEELQLQWTLQLPEPRPAWPAEQGKIQFDASYEPVAAEGRLFVPSMVRDCVTAYNAASGQRLWRFYANGPVRFAPLVDGQRVYFVADDGWLYCLNAASGELSWKVRGGPDQRMVLGNDRLVSMWPARGAPVLHEGTIYFAAGIWPFMGIFIHAVDAETGDVIWTNSGSGANYLVQQHNSPAFAGVAPQGYLAATDDVLLVSGGMTVPAAYDRHTGEFLYFRPGVRTAGKDAGGYEVMAGDDWYVNRGVLYRLSDGEVLGRFDPSVVTDDLAVTLESPNSLAGFQLRMTLKEVTVADRRGVPQTETRGEFPQQWTAELPADTSVDAVHFKAGRQLFATGADGEILAIELPSAADAGDAGPYRARVTWRSRVAGEVWRMLADGQRLFVVTRGGEIHCFGSGTLTPSRLYERPPQRAAAAPQPTRADDVELGELLVEPALQAGYCLVSGCGDVRLLEQLARQSNLHVVALDADADRCAAARRQLDGAGLLGERVAVVEGDMQTIGLPPYMATLILCVDEAHCAQLLSGESPAATLAAMFRPLRPYGGTAILASSADTHAAVASAVAQLPGGELQRHGKFSVVRRVGALPESGSWTHQSGDVANSLVSQDRRVKLPLGLLWFGGPSNRDVLPRHGHGPAPQVIGGRLFIEGPDMLRSVDVYTGRLLWQRELPEIGLYYDNTGHHPGAGAIGGNFVSVEDGIYVAYGREGLRLDPATGATLATFTLPDDESGERPVWGYIGVWDDLLIAGSSPVAPLSRSRAGDAEDEIYTRYGEGSRRLVVMDRYNGEVLWTRDAVFNFRHNALAAGGGRVYCLDRITDARREYLRRRGRELTGGARLLALDARTGNVVWQHDEDAFGTWLAYSEPHDLLLQAGSAYRDRAVDETGRGMAVYQAASGEVLWRNNDIYPGPPMLLGDQVVTQSTAVSLLTGARVERCDPLTGEARGWNFTRNYGCNTAIGCPQMLTFRSAAAGYFDLASDGGTGNLGGFRSSCTSNLIPADGVLNAPDYTRTCTCSYQNQCSLALVHMPDVEMWTFNSSLWSGRRVRHVGLNFGAPGDRRAANGVLWLDYPSVGGTSPDLPVEVAGEDVKYHRRHASQVAAAGPSWVQASAVSGLESLRLTLVGDDAAAADQATGDSPTDDQAAIYTVRLYFTDPDNLPPGERVFDVELQGDNVLRGFDIARSVRPGESGVVREFHGVSIARDLEIGFRNIRGRAVLSGVEVEIEQPVETDGR